MNALKLTFVLAGLLLVTRYAPVYYNSSEFGEFVKRQAAHARSESQLKQSLLIEAQEYSLPVKESDISIDETDDVLRVTVDYQVPVNLLIYNPALKFRIMGSGMLPRQ